jgi:predicted transcriptional regulator of viral defense system
MKPTLADLADRLQAEGRYTFTRDEALGALNSSPTALRQAAARLARARRLVMPRRGFYVIVPLEHRSAGAPPPSWYVDELLRHAGMQGYVGLLSAAALYGAAHHAPQAYQLVTDRQVRPITVGRSRLHFAYKRDAADTATVRRKTETGTMSVSTPEATAFDLLRYVDLVGGVDAAATVLSELGEQLDPGALAAAAVHVPRTVAQRVGWLLDRVGHQDRTGLLHAALASQPWATVDLRPGSATDAAPDPSWHVRVDRDVEVDA